VQGVATVIMGFDTPVAVMDFVVTVPAHHHHVFHAGRATLRIRDDVVGLTYLWRRTAMKTASIISEQCLPLRL